MTCFCWLLMALLADLPQVQVETLKSGSVEGALQQVTASQIVLDTRTVPLTDVVEIRFAAPVPTPAANPNPVEVVLNDGSRLTGTQATAKGGELSLEAAELGTIKIRKTVIKSLRLAAADPKVDDAWQKLVNRESKKDLIIVRKEDKLDFVAGVAGEIDAKAVKFLIDGEEVPVSRERVYGLIFQPAAPTVKPQAILDLWGDLRLQAKGLTLKDDKFQVALISGVNATVPLNQVRSVDYSLGKIQQLSSLKPSDIQFVPMFEDVPGYYNYQKDNGPLRTPISIGGQIYAKGLSIHSKTKLSFRLQGDYRRFQTTVGIDDQADDTGLRGDVLLKILGDDKVLLEAEVRGPDVPRKVDLDISGVKELQILVDFGGDLDIADWLSLGDAKVIK